MKFEIGGFILWVIVYLSMKLLVESFAGTDYWFFWGTMAGIFCSAIIRGVSWLKKERASRRVFRTEIMDNQWKELYTIADKAIDDSNRRMGIIKEMYGFLRQCPYCGVEWGHMTNHGEDCKLAKELADE